MSTLRIGVVGYSAQPFDQQVAAELLERGIAQARSTNPNAEMVEIVSGLTNVGIPKLAYMYARRLGMRTVGIACGKAFSYECFPVDNLRIVGTDWGDESETFLGSVDAIVRVGGGNYTQAEIARAKELNIPTFEFDLPVLSPVA